MKIALLLSLLFSISAFGQNKKVLSKEQFEQKRWKHILKLIDQEMATIKRARRKSQKLQYRMFELKSEKIKLYKEKENKKFMALKMKHGRKIKRKNVFKKTQTLYKNAHKYGHSLLKKYPRSKYKAAIYYTLALNSRDFAYDGKELGYLRMALKNSRNGSNVKYLARTSLAEYYYNNKKWKNAIYQYEKVIHNRDDEWHTKNLLNYGWCLLKDQRFDDAINSLEKSHHLSEDEFYVDVRDQAMTGLISFYVYGKQIRRGVKFIDTHAVDKHASLLKLAQKASGKGYFVETEEIVADLEKRISPEKETELYADFRLFQFDLYKQFHKPQKLLRIAKLFPGIKFQEYQREDAIYKISNVVGAKQVILKKDFSKYDKQYNKGTLVEIITYFDILASIDVKEKAQYEYYKAETYYSVHKFKDALASYKVSLVDYDKKASKEDLRAKSMDAIFSCIDFIKFSKEEKASELDFAYNRYLNYWPNDDKAQKIYPRLFALYANKKLYPKMQASLDRYIKNFPNDLKKQQDLYRSQLDLLIKDENTQLLAGKISQMQKGYLKFKTAEVEKSETILANILFNSFQKLNEKGETKEALAGYKKVHFTDYYPRSIKAEAAFNMGMIYTDIEDNSNALKWYQRSFDLYNKKEKQAKRPFLEKMATRTALLHNFLNAAKLNKFILKNYCSEKEKNIEVFKAAIRNDLANDYITKVFYTYNKQSKCISEVPKELKEEILTHLFENDHEDSFISFIDSYKLQKEFKEKISFYYERLFWKYYGKSLSKEKRFLGKLKKLKEKNADIFIGAFKAQWKFNKSVDKFLKKTIKISKKKPNPDHFMAALNKRFADLGPIIQESNKIFEMGHGQVSVMVYDNLARLTRNLKTELEGYYIPIKDPEFQKGFKNFMAQYISKIASQNQQYLAQSQNLIEKYEVLTLARKETHSGEDVLNISDIRPKAESLAITFGLGAR